MTTIRVFGRPDQALPEQLCDSNCLVTVWDVQRVYTKKGKEIPPDCRDSLFIEVHRPDSGLYQFLIRQVPDDGLSYIVVDQIKDTIITDSSVLYDFRNRQHNLSREMCQWLNAVWDLFLSQNIGDIVNTILEGYVPPTYKEEDLTPQFVLSIFTPRVTGYLKETLPPLIEQTEEYRVCTVKPGDGFVELEYRDFSSS
jgi:hypothetical protein